MRMLENKRAQIGLLFNPTVWVLVLVLIAFTFGFTGLLRFLFSDKTGYIIVAAFVFVFLLSRRNR